MEGSTGARQRTDLRLRVTAGFAIAGLAVAATATAIAIAGFESPARAQLERDAALIARQLAASAAGPLAAGELEPLRALVAGLDPAPALELSVLDAGGIAVASTDPMREGRPAPEAFRATSSGAVLHAEGSPGAGPDAVLLVAPVRAGGQTLGSVAVRLPTAHLGDQRAAVLRSHALVGVLVACVGAALAYALVGRLLRPVELIGDALEALARGRTDTRVDPATLSPHERAGQLVNALAASYQEIAAQVVGMADRLQAVIARIVAVTNDVESGSGEQNAAIEEAASLLGEIDGSIRGITSEVEGLSRSTEEASSSVLEMGSSIDEVARSMDSLNHAVESASSSSQEMGVSIRQVAESADEVQRMAEETAASMTQMDRAIQQVSEHVRQASELTEQVSSSAEDGSRAVETTIEGMSEIRELALEQRSVLDRLAGRIGEIGEILNVIGSINDEANLLSLNAAIIAAQAGEQGKAFAVVANHVKTLAQRTANSTQEIERLIHAVQEESGNAMKAMEAGIGSVESGVQRSRRAGEVLAQIRSSASDANTRVSEISRAASEQERNSKHVAEAANRTSSMVLQISNAMGEQSTASEQVLRTSESALEVCRQVHRSTDEQRETGRFITDSITSISEMMRRIQQSLGAHAQSTGSASQAVQRVLEGAHKSSSGVRDLASSVEELRADAERMTGLLDRLRSGVEGDAESAADGG